MLLVGTHPAQWGERGCRCGSREGEGVGEAAYCASALAAHDTEFLPGFFPFLSGWLLREPSLVLDVDAVFFALGGVVEGGGGSLTPNLEMAALIAGAASQRRGFPDDCALWCRRSRMTCSAHAARIVVTDSFVRYFS